MNPKDQVGCGYCRFEKSCGVIDKKTNFAKAGCPCFIHHQSEENKKYSMPDMTIFINKISKLQ